ncbi:hypothetical protein Kpol_1007p5, partial [Vanderwaltozyma polyspora DSM 70294]
MIRCRNSVVRKVLKGKLFCSGQCLQNRLGLRYASSVDVSSMERHPSLSMGEEHHWKMYKEQLKDVTLQQRLKSLEDQWFEQKLFADKSENDNEGSGLDLPKDKSGKKNVPKRKDDTSKSIPEDQQKQKKKVPTEEENNTTTTEINESTTENITSEKVSASNPTSSVPPSNSNGDGDGNGNNDGGNGKNQQKKLITVPKIYPQMLGLPLSRRPLFPGFYKAVVISDERVMNAIKEMYDRQKPYFAAFMLKDSNMETDIIENVKDVYETGVFAQVTSIFPSTDEKTGATVMTALVYPHRRIKIDELIPPVHPKVQDTQADEKTDSKLSSKTPEDSSVETSIVDEIDVIDNEGIVSKTSEELIEEEEEEDESNPTNFLKKFDVSLVNVSNLEDEPFDRKS